MSKEKIEVGDWVLTSVPGEEKYDSRVLQVHHLDDDNVYLTPGPGAEGDWRFAFSEVTKVSHPSTHDPVDPKHYQFPSGVEVRQISGYLTGFGAQALQYVARATRMDDGNKGDRIEDLRKSIKFIEWEIERLEAQ